MQEKYEKKHFFSKVERKMKKAIKKRSIGQKGWRIKKNGISV